MSTVAIIGAGDIGAACAQALAAADRVGRVLLVDEAVKAAAGKALDIQQSGAVDRFHTVLGATDDFSSVMSADVCVIADRFGPPAAEWSVEQGVALIDRITPFVPKAPIVFAGTMIDVMRYVNVRRNRLIGSAAEAFASAARSIVALEARCSPAEVMLTVLGVPRGFVVPWSDASIGGYALERTLAPPQVIRIEARFASLWPPGPYTLGVAAARMAEAIVTTSRRRFSALTMLGGEFGVRNRIGALPVLLNEQGIIDVRVPTLSTRERVMVETALGS